MSNNSDDGPAVIEARHFETASKFLAALRRTDPYWLAPDSWGGDWLFRGEATDSNTLKPSAWRDEISNHEIYKLVESWDYEARIDQITRNVQHKFSGLDKKRDILRRLLVQTTFEAYIAWIFQEMVDELGLPIPGGKLSRNLLWADPLRVEVKGAPNSYDDIHFGGETRHPVFALAQHHRMPTRLLDWTENPLIAAFFAAEGTDQGDEGNLLVWAANRTALHRSPIREFTVERSQIGFLHAQEGLFTYLHSANFHYLHSNCWHSIEEFVPEALRRLTLPKSQGPELRRLLWAEGISRAHLMPTLDNISVALKDYWQQTLSKTLSEIRETAEKSDSEQSAQDSSSKTHTIKDADPRDGETHT